ncbi:YbgS-like family protein [Pantoea allii]|uniref:YbgS-like family protein n=1 Tax=Pantoea allii TaxID=574096 RepID=A0ABS6VDI5_9GAMM|nr:MULTISPECIES: YbgS-like family protein [Pantoea]MBW1213389.1 YbgS-like family protein [Pantoea allii]MBW1257367.1 YbgS-like family protein [Pantoea allii]MBW1266445.1 YbgS-like family protein [Pantoea allii]MBW1288177.1 YbgS-like family protein [Pantoea allii]OAE07766.1 homeobox protein YbgS [Pantoea sp. OXWO6B1]
MMNKFAIIFLTAAMTLGSGAAMAANGNSNQAAAAGAVAGGANENLPPNKVDNSKINNTGTEKSSPTADSTSSSKHMTADEIDKNTQCKDGKCPDMNKKVHTKKGGGHVNTKTDGTTQ